MASLWTLTASLEIVAAGLTSIKVKSTIIKGAGADYVPNDYLCSVINQISFKDETLYRLPHDAVGRRANSLRHGR